MKRRAAAVLLTAALTLAPAANAQTVDLAPRPPEPAPVPFRFPVVTTRTLPNGLRLVVSENHAVPVVAVRIETFADSTLDPAGLHGLSDVVEHSLGQASARFSSAALSDTLAALGVSFNDTSFSTRVGNLPAVLGIMADLLMHPVFTDASVDAAKAAVAQSRRSVENSTSGLAREVMYGALFGASNPFGNRPTVASIAAISRHDVERFHADWYRPDRLTLIMVGDVTPAAAEREAMRAFGSWRAVASAPAMPSGAPISAPATPAPTTIYLIDRPGAKQSTIVLGAVGPAPTPADYAAASALDANFGATASSRLTQTLRQQHAWAYTASSRVDLHRADEPTVLWASADVAPAATDSSVAAALQALRAAGQPDANDETGLRSANAIVLGTLQRLIATDDALAARLKGVVESGLGVDFYVRLASAMDHVTAEQVAQVANAYDNPDHLVVVVVGDRASIEAPLRALGHPLVNVPPPGP